MFANDGFKIRGWDETGLHVGSVHRFGSSIRLSARSLPRMPMWPGSQQRSMSKPDALSDVSLEMISSIMGWSILRWSSACRHDMESVKIQNLFILECSMHSKASSMARASAVKMELSS